MKLIHQIIFFFLPTWPVCKMKRLECCIASWAKLIYLQCQVSFFSTILQHLLFFIFFYFEFIIYDEVCLLRKPCCPNTSARHVQSRLCWRVCAPVLDQPNQFISNLMPMNFKLCL